MRRAGLAALLLVAGCTPAAPTDALQTRPNVLLIVTDDQRAEGTLRVMPQVRTRFGREGMTFTDAYVTTPLCCPARASIYTGRYAHNHGVQKSVLAPELPHAETLQAKLQEAGYRTAIFGKFFNGEGWDVASDPPHFDEWAIVGGDYFATTFNVDGELRIVPGYATTYVFDRAVDFVAAAERDDGAPWFLVVAPTAPHPPFTPDRRYSTASVPPARPARAPKHRGGAGRFPYVDRAMSGAQGELTRVRQLRTLMSVDDGTGRLLDALDDHGERDTLAIYTSDNGYLWGEHGLGGKRLPYLEAVKVPLLLRWPGHVEPGTRDDRLVANIDIAPTVADAAGIEMDADGWSLLSSHTRRRLLLEHWGNLGKDLPDWRALLSRRLTFIEYPGRNGKAAFRELYDLRSDPGQTRNLLAPGNPSRTASVEALSALLARLAACRGPECRRLDGTE